MTASEDAERATSQQPKTTSHTPRLIAGGVLLLIGLLWLLERIGALELNATTVLALATLVVGIALMILAREGAHGGLITLGIILAVVTGLTALAPVEGFQGGVGERVVEVDTASELAPGYEVAMGQLTIDLRDLEDQGDLGVMTASVGMGELVIRVPADMGVEVRAQAGAGEIDFFGETIGGVGVEETRQTAGFEDAGQQLAIEAEVFMGRVEVTDR